MSWQLLETSYIVSDTYLALINIELDEQETRVLQAEVTKGRIKVLAGFVPRGVEVDHALLDVQY